MSTRVAIRPTHRQRVFARAYLETGCAAEAARLAGYEGFYAPQAGYKLLRLRLGTGPHIERLVRFDRLLLRRDLLRALRRIQRVLAPRDAPLRVLKGALGPIVHAVRCLGIDRDPACQPLVHRLGRRPPNLRRFYRLPWEDSL